MKKAFDGLRDLDIGKFRDFESVRERSYEIVIALLGNRERGSQRQLAERLGVDPGVISKIVKGERLLPRKAIVQLVKMSRGEE